MMYASLEPRGVAGARASQVPMLTGAKAPAGRSRRGSRQSSSTWPWQQASMSRRRPVEAKIERPDLPGPSYTEVPR